ncbi:hypothetical protein GP486_004944 [Trichoglossum hirsutum]|uniref:Protein with SprT-like domain at the N terminus n=1 Tax=Trichoglossum hirsutum TaxID=265104 RepID=A0A9P8LA20_9PEZI|nr:hypothetical protein GP486_004944 [Trichoglossum hirsutum]
MSMVSDEDAALQAASSLDSLSAAQQSAASQIDRLIHSGDGSPFVDIQRLLPLYDVLYFRGRLSGNVEVSWSKRLTLTHPSAPCKGNPRLTEYPGSIHAYLFLATSYRHSRSSHEDDGHGPGFVLLATSINNHAKTNITTHHDFDAEVDSYRTHIWQCSGICRQKPPHFGLVKRAMNRPPGKSDAWFARHEEECGGTWEKIAEPEPKVPLQKAGKPNQTGKQKNNLDGWIKKEKKDAAPLTTTGQLTTSTAPTSPTAKRSRDPTSNGPELQPSSDKKLIVECPICSKPMFADSINEHLDLEHCP